MKRKTKKRSGKLPETIPTPWGAIRCRDALLLSRTMDVSDRSTLLAVQLSSLPRSYILRGGDLIVLKEGAEL